MKPTPERIDQAIATKQFDPRPENHEEQIQEYLRRALYDPHSIQDFKLSELERSYAYNNGGLLFPERFWWGWTCSAEYRAKNRMGGYTGLQTTHFYFRRGKLEGTEIPVLFGRVGRVPEASQK